METKDDGAFRSAAIGAWITTRMEKDKTLLALATGGIGLLTTLLMTVGPSSYLVLVLYGVAGVSFLVTIVTALRIFDGNSRHLEDVLRNGTIDDDPYLQRLDRLLLRSFMVGLAVTGIVAAVSGYSLMEKNRPMVTREDTGSETGASTRSLSGIGKLNKPSSPGGAASSTRPSSTTQGSGQTGSTTPRGGQKSGGG